MTRSPSVVETRDLTVYGELFAEEASAVGQDAAFMARLRFTATHASWAIASAEVAGRSAWYGRRPGHHHIFQIATEGEQFHHGVRLAPGRLIIHRPSSEIIARTPLRCVWAVAGLAQALADPILASLRVQPRHAGAPILAVNLTPRAWQRLTAAFRAAQAAVADDVVGGPPPERHQAALLAALGKAVQTGRVLAPSKTFSTISCAEAVIAAAGVQRVRLQELAGAAGISERALRQAFLKAYGMGPVELLKARQLALARLMLRRSGRRGSVSSIAAKLGVFSFGRFAVEYRRLFGESPSKTLSRGNRAG